MDDVIDGTINGVAMGHYPVLHAARWDGPVGLYLSPMRSPWCSASFGLITWMSLQGGQANGQPSFHRHLYAALAALILAMFLRGDDEAAQRNAKWLAMIATATHSWSRCSSWSV